MLLSEQKPVSIKSLISFSVGSSAILANIRTRNTSGKKKAHITHDILLFEIKCIKKTAYGYDYNEVALLALSIFDYFNERCFFHEVLLITNLESRFHFRKFCCKFQRQKYESETVSMIFSTLLPGTCLPLNKMLMPAGRERSYPLASFNGRVRVFISLPLVVETKSGSDILILLTKLSCVAVTLKLSTD